MGSIKVNVKETQPRIDRVKIENDQLIVTGSNLENVTIAKIEGSTNHSFQIETKSSTQLVLNAKSALNIFVGQALNLIVSNAQASATFPISFELQNGQVTAAKLHHMGASSGQYLRFNGTAWAPASISTSQIFAGAYDAATDSPDIVSIGGSSGTYYIVTVAGSQDLGSGSEAFDVGDWVIYNGSSWSRIAVGTNTVSGFNGRTGLVIPLSGDYSWSMLTKAAGKLTGSKLSEIADVDVAGIQDGDILQWNAGGSKWEVNSIPAPTIAAGSISNTQLANSAVDSNKIVDGTIINADVSATAAIAQSKIQNLTTDLGNKEPLLPTGGTTAQYLRGNKTLATLDTAAVPENGNLYFTPARVLGTLITTYTTGGSGAIAVTDTVPQALSKLETKTNTLGNYVLRDGSSGMTGDLQMGAHKITGLATPTANTDAATKAYVDLVAGGGGSSQWTTAGSTIHYNSGKVGIGTAAPSTLLEISTGATPPAADVNLISMSIQSNVTDSSGSGGAYDNGLKKYQIGVSDDQVPDLSNSGLTNEGAGTAMAFSMTPIHETDVSGTYFTNYVFRGPTNASDFWISNGNIYPKGIVIGFNRFATAPISDGAIINGNVGIGVAIPMQKLSVDGSIGLKSTTANYIELRAPAGLGTTLAFNFPSTYGSNNQVLTTDGSGNLSWTTPAGGGGAPTGSAGGDLAGTYPNPTIAAGLDAIKIGGGAISNTEFSYLDGLTSSIQSQLTGKEPTITAGTTAQYLRGNKTLGNFDTDVVAALLPLGFSASGAGDVGPLDSMQTALAKLQGQIDGHDTQIAAATTWSKNGSSTYYNAGSVGIGVNNPAAPLHVRGPAVYENIAADSSGSTFSFWKSRNFAATEDADEIGYINFFGHDGTNLLRSAYILSRTEGTSAAGSAPGNLSFHTTSHGDPNSTEKMKITADGYVGIGTTDPWTNFHVHANPAVQLALTNDNGGLWMGAEAGHGFINNDQPSGFLTLETNGSEVIRITDTYRVGIGTQTPTTKLEVNGSIKIGNGNETCSSTTSGAIRYVGVTTEFCNGINWVALGNNEAIPTSTTLLMKACPTGWTDIGATGAGQGAATCNGTSCRMCTSPATASGIPASSILLMDKCPNNWTNLGPGAGPNAAGIFGVVFTACQSPANPSSLPNKVKIMATSCPSSWSDLGGTGPGPTTATCSGSSCRICEVAAVSSSVILSASGGSTSAGESLIVRAGNGGSSSGNGGIATLSGGSASEGDGGDVKVTGGNAWTLSSTDRKGGNVVINGGDAATNGNGGDVLINGGNPTGSGSRGVVRVKGNVDIDSGYSLLFNGSTVCTSSGCNSPSDRRLKKNINPLQDSLLKITQLQGVEYFYIDSKKFGKQHQVGVIAQDVEKVFPEVVKTDEKTGFKAVAYDHLVAPIIEAIKELHKMVVKLMNDSERHNREIASLKNENEKLKDKADKVQQENAAIKAYLCQKDPAAPICR